MELGVDQGEDLEWRDRHWQAIVPARHVVYLSRQCAVCWRRSKEARDKVLRISLPAYVLAYYLGN